MGLAAALIAMACGGSQREEGSLLSGIAGMDTGQVNDSSDGTTADEDEDEGEEEDTGTRLDVSAPQTGGADGGDAGDCPCENVLDGIYVLHSQGPLNQPEVHFFDPPANAFSLVGQLSCSVPSGYVTNSMAIDRAGSAWINFYHPGTQTGLLFRAPLSDLTQCEQVAYAPPPDGWFLLGMGYATVTETSACDDLFIYKSDRYLEYPNYSGSSAALGQYEESSGVVELLGVTDYPVGELTGTGDGRLFTLAAVSPSLAVLVNLDKLSGAELEHTNLDGFDITSAFAFGFWGGDFYLFTETAPQSGVSQVTKFDYDGNEGGGRTQYNANTGLQIVGAGVSTCASFEPPA